MNEWISVKDRLPKNIPIYQPHLPPSPTYDWVPVTDGKGCWTIARYGHHNDGKGNLTECWDFWTTSDDTTGCPYAGDSVNIMNIEDITHWMDIWENMPERNHEK